MRMTVQAAWASGAPGAAGALASRRRLPAAVLVMPAVALLAVFVGWPVLQVVLLSLFEWNLVSPDMTFVGLANYLSLLTDPKTEQILFQSAAYVAAALLGGVVAPVGLALLTTAVPARAAAVYQWLLFTPSIISASVASQLWEWIYLPVGGGLNALAALLRLPAGNWLNDPRTALAAVAVVVWWKYAGFNYLVALAGLAAIPRDCLEAARIDGARGWRLARHVVLPLLAPTLLFIVLTATLTAMSNAFVPIDVLTGGGPAGASSNLLYAAYQDGLRFFRVGLGSAENVLLIALLGGAAFWQLSWLRRSRHDR